MIARTSNRLIQSQKLSLNLGLAASIRVLRHDASGLTRYLEDQAAENPYLTLVKPEPTEWLPRWTQAFAATGWGGDALAAEIPAHSPGLIAHVERESARLVPGGPARAIAALLIEALDPTGWLGRPLTDLAREAGASVTDVEAVLTRLQKMEPRGLFARSLAECLRLQALEAGAMTTVMSCVLDHLDLLARGQTARLAQMCAVDEAVILACARQIRGFDPKPGAQFGQGAADVREPDLIVTRDGAGWRVTLNRSALPDIVVEHPGSADRHDPAALAAARGLVHMVHSRNVTLLRIATEVVNRQTAAFDKGPEALLPMTMADLGAALDLHESTISRAAAGVSLDTPRGTFWLRALFSAAAGPTAEAAAALRARLARLIADEDKSNPLGDEALAQALSQDGTRIARRTLAKYRDMLGIPAAHRRRRR